MKKACIFSLLVFLFPLLASCLEEQVHIVYFGEHSGERALHEIEDTHHSYLLAVKETDEKARASLLYSYKHSINGFAAVLTPDEASKLSEMEEVVSVFPTHPRKYTMHTTRSWEFAGLDEGGLLHRPWNHFFRGGEDLLLQAKYGRNVIVGVVDSGVWPESESFSDEGLGPIPKSWKGACQTGTAFYSYHCNKKIIGARFYLSGYEQKYGRLNETVDYRSPRDIYGHGTHTASTVTGQPVRAAALGGFASGLASGGAPLARLAIYKACWLIPNQERGAGNICFEEDMLAAIDDAIGDGVHVISISIAAFDLTPYAQDGIAIGALHAVKRNIVVACSAGNSGPTPGTVSNMAPWIITVGASSLDRSFPAPVVLGNGVQLVGETVTPYRMEQTMHPLVYAGNVEVPQVPQNASGNCLPGSLLPDLVKGKVVVCINWVGYRVGKGMEVQRAGGAGMILVNPPAVYGNDDSACDAHVLPATVLNVNDGATILAYINSYENPLAMIKPAITVLNTKPAPIMAAFSSQGPSTLDPNILKPDITAPGLNILAAWSPASSPTQLSEDHRSVKYNIDSGTSMACPHVAAAAALLRGIHPRWSSAAIRSALMTTAWTRNNLNGPITDVSGNIATPFQFGSGHFRPAKAADPGLVYDASFTDYLLYLCSVGSKIKNFNPTFKCPPSLTSSRELNYPSIAIPNINGTVAVKRTVTNVSGTRRSVYFFSAKSPQGVSVKAFPSILCFNRLYQKKSFTIIVTPTWFDPTISSGNGYEFGWYTWSDGLHDVRSPIAVSFA